MKAYRKKQSVRCQSMFSASLPLRRVLNVAILALLYPSLAHSNPDGAQVINGQVSIDSSTPGVTTVTNSPNAIINWQNFSIGQNELTRFIQQNGQSAVLNRIIGQNPSEILGQLVSNGKVFLINPNGIVFGAGSVIDTQGLIASTLNLSDQDFLSGNYHFMAGSSAGNIINEGIIRAGKDGNIILIAPKIENNGIIKSDGGTITLAAGHELTITNLDNPDIRFQIQAPADSVLNLGKLLSEGGAINVFASTITHSGEINADSVQVDKQGHIQLVAQQDITLESGSKISANNSQGDAGTIHIDSKTGTTLAQGTIEAQTTQTGSSTQLTTGKGGNIELLGERVGVLDQAHIDASGENGGGQVLIGGDYQGKNPVVHNAKATYIGKDTIIKADAETNGDGGKIIAWSDESTRVYGDISAKGGSLSGNGGFIETSGHWLDTTGIRINASSAYGHSGEWLLDPYNVTINATGSTTTGPTFPNWTAGSVNSLVLNTDINNQLTNGTSVTISTGNSASPGTDAGNITVNAAITRSTLGPTPGSTAAVFTLDAAKDIILNSAISNTNTTAGGKLDVVLQAGNRIDLTNSNASINLVPSGGTAGGVKLVAGAGGIDNANHNNTILTNTLEINSAGSVLLGGTNKVNTLAASVTGGTGFSFTNSIDLNIGSVGSTTGITTSNQSVSLFSNALNINKPINVGTGSVDLTTDKLVWDSGGIGKVSGNQVGIRPLTAGRPVTVGAECIGGVGTCLSITELWKVTSPVIGLGKHDAGDIFVSGITSGSSTLTDRNTVTTRIGLLSGAGITQGSTGINVQDLGIEANGTVLLSAANNITNLAAKTLGQSFTFNNAKGVNVTQLSGGTAPHNYDINGIITNGGNVSLTTTSGALTVLNPINAGAGAGSVSLAASTSDTLSINALITAPGGITLKGGSLTGSYANLYWQYFNNASAGGNTLSKLTQITIAGVLGTMPSIQPSADEGTGGNTVQTTEKDKKTNGVCTK